ncbi:MAG: metal-dependent transcriptional regulator [Archaeoglobus sp.]|jgi:DtxR family Mn-dependent transcriptional regulator|nr:MAG: metal-dependent transcriptional regulator [Archaeoglobus sp.]
MVDVKDKKKRMEDYLEAIYNIQKSERRVARTTDLARVLEVRPSSVTEMLLKLSDMGYVEYTPYRGVILTKKGEEVAVRIRRYHKIFEAFFYSFLGVDRSEAHRLSCEIEHHVSEDVALKICTLIANECNLCDVCEFKVFKLSYAEPGTYRVIVSPVSLRDIGIEPGVVLKVTGQLKIEVNGNVLSISEKYASLILLERVE